MKKGATTFGLTQCLDIKVSGKENGTLLLLFGQRRGGEGTTAWERYWRTD